MEIKSRLHCIDINDDNLEEIVDKDKMKTYVNKDNHLLVSTYSETYKTMEQSCIFYVIVEKNG